MLCLVLCEVVKGLFVKGVKKKERRGFYVEMWRCGEEKMSLFV